MSQDSRLDSFISPWEEGELDHKDPNNHAREPNPAVVAEHQRKHKPTRWERPWPSKRKLWPAHKLKLAYPELFRCYYTDDCIKQFQSYVAPRPEVRVWIKDILAAGDLTDDPNTAEERYTVAVFPGTMRECIFEKVQHPERGDLWQMIYHAMEKVPHGEYMPPDHQTEDARFEHLRGMVGDFRNLTAEDFKVLRDKADRRKYTATEQVHKFEAPRKKAYLDEHKEFVDELRAEIEYQFNAIYSIWNDGAKRMLPMTSLEEIEQRRLANRYEVIERPGYRVLNKRVDGYKVMARKDTEAATEIKAEREAIAQRQRLSDEVIDMILTEAMREGLIEQKVFEQVELEATK